MFSRNSSRWSFAEDDAGVGRHLFPLVGELPDAGLAGVVAPLAFVVSDPRGDVLPRPPLDQLVEGEALALEPVLVHQIGLDPLAP